MKTTRTVLATLALTGLAAAANADSFTIDWMVNGQQAVTVNPGDVVQVIGRASWTNPPANVGLSGSLFKVTIAGASAAEGLTYTEASGLGRNPSLRFRPQTLTDVITGGGREIRATTGTFNIDAYQLPPAFNGAFNASNPIDIFKFDVTVAPGVHTLTIDSIISSASVYAASGSAITIANRISDPATITVTPAPGAAALLSLGGLVAVRRRRA